MNQLGDACVSIFRNAVLMASINERWAAIGGRHFFFGSSEELESSLLDNARVGLQGEWIVRQWWREIVPET